MSIEVTPANNKNPKPIYVVELCIDDEPGFDKDPTSNQKVAKHTRKRLLRRSCQLDSTASPAKDEASKEMAGAKMQPMI
jgi:hypothetical protein